MTDSEFHALLKKLDSMIDTEKVRESEARMLAVACCEKVDFLPLAIGYPAEGWPRFTYGDTLDDPRSMLINELGPVYQSAIISDDRMYTIRADFGVGNVPSAFGCKIVLPDKNNKPWVEHLSREELDKILDSGDIQVGGEWIDRLYDFMRFYQNTFAEYPHLAETVQIYLADT